MIPEDLHHTHAVNAALVPATVELTFPDNDPDPIADRCPTCGRAIFDLHASGMLDTLALIRDALSDLQAALEAQGVQP